MKFWKFQYEGAESLRHCIDNRCLPPSSSAIFGLQNTNAHPIKSMRAGDGVVLAVLDGDEGKIFAVGKVLTVETLDAPAVITWAATRKTVYPNASGGLVNWKNKSAFEISAEPAKRYGLRELIEYYVRSD